MFQSKTSSGILCPHCERPLGAEHDEVHCQRRMSRRYFFGAALGGVVAAAAAPVVIPETVKFGFPGHPKTLVSEWTVGEWRSVQTVTVNLMFQGDPDTADKFSALCEQFRERIASGEKLKAAANWVTIEKK